MPQRERGCVMKKTEILPRPESFVFYRSFRDAIDECPENTQLELYRAMTKYVFEGVQPAFADTYARIVWKLIKPQLDANLRRRENGFKGASSGKLGGAPKGNLNAKKQPLNNP